jgi:hypothetical protein
MAGETGGSRGGISTAGATYQPWPKSFEAAERIAAISEAIRASPNRDK